MHCHRGGKRRKEADAVFIITKVGNEIGREREGKSGITFTAPEAQTVLKLRFAQLK